MLEDGIRDAVSIGLELLGASHLTITSEETNTVGHPKLGWRETLELTAAVRHALDGNAVLFTGAGFSLGAVNKAGTSFPLSNDLSEHLMGDLKETERVPLQTAAELYVGRHGEVGLLDNLNKHLGVISVGAHHEEFARIPWRRVYTTNYDEVFEIACRQQSVNVSSAIATGPLTPLAVRSVTCVHLNGFLPSAKVGNLEETLILSERSYLTSKLTQSPWFSLFLDDLRSSRAILFLGYSASDLDISRVLVGKTIARKAVFVVHSGPSLALRTTIAQFGTISEIGVEGAALVCADVRASHDPKQAALEFASFRRRSEMPPRATPPTVNEVFDLLIRGELNPQLLVRGINEPRQRYLVSRRAVDEVADRFREGAPIVAVLSRLANGKTTVLEQVCFKLADRFDVLHFDRETSSLEAEIAALRAPERPTLVVFDDYSRHMRTISSLFLGASQNLVVLLGCRTPTHLTHQGELKKAAGNREVVEFRIDKLSELEFEQLDAILAGAGLLGELASPDPAKRRRYLRERGKSELGGLLLWLLEAPHIQRRIQDAFTALSGRSDVHRVVIACLLMTHVGAPPDIYDLVELIGAKAINQALFAESEEVSHLVRLDADRLYAHSSLFASAAIRTLWQADERMLLEVVEEIIERAWQGGRRDTPFHRIARDMMRYSVVKAMAPRSDAKNHIRNYYERIRNLDACANNDLFWLQFAIAEISAGSFFQAGKHIDTSYALAKRMRGYRTDHHDNVKASFLLAREAAEPDAARAFKSFIEARRIINVQMTGGQHKYYPFRVAQRYGDFWCNVAARWEEPNRRIFLDACRAVLEQLDLASPDISTMDDLVRCRAEINMLLTNARASTISP